MNHQTPGPIAVKGASRDLFADPTFRNADGLIAATRFLGSGIDAKEEHWTNAELLAASYTAFDRAGRELGVDATELARAIDLAEVIRYALDYARLHTQAHHTGEVGRIDQVTGANAALSRIAGMMKVKLSS